MGNSYLWWYPQGATGPQAIDLGRKVSDLQLTDTRDRVDAVPGWGSPSASDLGGARIVRITLERIDGFSAAGLTLIRKLRTLETHLKRGGFVAFSLDTDKTYGAWCLRRPIAGDTSVVLRPGGNQFGAYNAGSIANGDAITIESPNPEMIREHHVVNTFSGLTCTPTESVYSTFEQGPVFFRYADFYPALWLPASQVSRPLMTSDYRRTWTLDLPMVEYPGLLEGLASTAVGLGDGTFAPSSGVFTLEQAVRAARRQRSTPSGDLAARAAGVLRGG